MSLLSNPNITRYGIVYSWNSTWVESNILYSSIIYTDIYMNEFINGIYYKFKMPTALPQIKNIGYNKTIIIVNSFMFYTKKKYNRWKKFFKYTKQFKFIMRRIFLYFNLALKYKKIKKNNMINNFISLYIIKCNNIFISVSSKKTYKPSNVIHYYYKKYIRLLSKYVFKKKSMFYKTYFIKQYSIQNNKKVKKEKIKRSQKINKKNIFNRKTKVYSNKSMKLNKFKSLYKHFNYNNIINKYKLLNIFKKKKYNIKSKLYFKIKKKKKKFKKILSNIKNSYYNIYMLYIYLLNKMLVFLYYLIVYQVQYYILTNKCISNAQILITKKIIFFLSHISNISKFNTSTFIIFNNLYKNNKVHNILKKYYRKKKKMERYNRYIKLNRFLEVYIKKININMFYTNNKYIRYLYRKLYYKQLGLKINNTLNTYLSNYIYYLHSYKRKSFNKINNPKIISDYIKLLMKYENKTPIIMRKIVKIHSLQRKKVRKYTYKYTKKIDYIINKMNIKYKKKNIKFSNKYINKQIRKKKSEVISGTNNAKYNRLSNKKINIIRKSSYKVVKKNRKKNSSIHRNKIKNCYYHNSFNLYLNKFKKHRSYFINNNKNYIINNYDNYIHTRSNLGIWLLTLNNAILIKYPLIGMRIELSGPTKKGRRTQTHLYNEWVDFYTLPGKMPLVSLRNDIQYWQSFGLTQRAAIGIKVWMHFHTSRYSNKIKEKING